MRDRNRKNAYWLDDHRNVTLVVYVLAAICALLVAAELFYHKHVHYAFEGWFGFHAFYGFIAFFLIVLAGRPLRRVLMRREDFYDRR